MIPLTDLLSPWYRRRGDGRGGGERTPGSVRPTRILDHESDLLRELIRDASSATGDRSRILRTAHAMISQRVRPVYSLDEQVPASHVLLRGAGSCSQRLAVLESVARGIGIPTRVRGLEVDCTFWEPRFPMLFHLMPRQVMLAWPEFRMDEEWVPVSELFGPIGCAGGTCFTNATGETLFEAVGRSAVDWDGEADPTYDLSGFVRADRGHFTDRDELFAALGQTLCLPSRTLVEPCMRRRTATA